MPGIQRLSGTMPINHCTKPNKGSAAARIPAVLLHYNAGAAALQTAHMPTTPPAQYTISEYPVSRLLFASHICSKGFHKTFLPCAADLQSLPFYGYDQLIHTLHMRQIYQIAVVTLIVMPLRELFLGAFQ